MSQLGLFAHEVYPGPTYDAPTRDGPGADHVRAQMEAENPQYGWSILRQLYRPWWLLDHHRQNCETCRPAQPCSDEAVYSHSFQHALKLISERNK